MKPTIKIIAALLVAASFTALACEERLLGESLDSGLGALGSNYTAAEFNPIVAGESLDSGLGELSREEMAKYVPDFSSLRKTARR